MNSSAIDSQVIDSETGVSASAASPHDIARDLMILMGDRAVGVIAVGSLGRRAAEGLLGTGIDVQDWDLMVIAKGLSEWERLALRRSIDRRLNANAGSHPLAVSVGILRRERMERLPFTLFNYEMRYAHDLLAGSNALEALPTYCADQMPLIETTRLLLNRGVTLWGDCVMSTCDLQPTAEVLTRLAGRNRKALLAMGDALLIADGYYDWSYRVRAERAGTCQALGVLGEEVRRKYVTALDTKQSGVLPTTPGPAALREETFTLLQLHERVFTFVEERRLGKSLGDWVEHLENAVDYPPYLRPSPLKRLARNLRGFGIPRSMAFQRMQRSQTDEEILLRAFPALAYHRLTERRILSRFLNWHYRRAVSEKTVWQRFHTIWARGH